VASVPSVPSVSDAFIYPMRDIRHQQKKVYA
jgi:hypothetical protein